jgi:predicted MPP superfamily phosphohydrolase
MLRILHLSDFHLSNDSLAEFEEMILRPLIIDISKFNDENKIDIIVFSGDLIDKGGTSFGSLQSAFTTFDERVVKPILEKIKLPRERFIFVPGNHDIDRKADSVWIDSGLQNQLNTHEKVNNYIDKGPWEGIKRIEAFKEFEQTFYTFISTTSELSKFQSVFKLNIDGVNVGVTCFNSAWRCYDSKTDSLRLLLGERQITNARKFIQDSDVKIAIMHHAFDCFQKFEAQDIENLISKDYDLLFCGHIHEGSTWSKSSMNNNLFVSVAPANWTTSIRSRDRTYSNGYSIIDYDCDSKQVTVFHRRYAYPKEVFDPNTDLGDECGKQYFAFLDSKEVSKRKTRKEICQNIKYNRIDEMNGHLLSYSTDTLAPKEIEKIFVMPDVIGNERFDVESKNSEKVFKLDEICSSNDNLIILGSKERGKTILLDRIMLELVDNVDTYNKLPVHINFEEFKANRVETTIARFLGISVVNIKRAITEYNIILLIDNLTFSNSRSLMLRKLEDFLNAFPEVQAIATCTPIVGDELPLELFEYPVLSTFKTLHIAPFKSKQIRALVKKWFRDHGDYNTPEKLTNLINLFGTLNIPNTPFALSMFLWIIEQQENYKPINSATMVENYVQRLFKKTSKREIYSDRFDYTNKERLLIEIARKMFQVNDLDYRLPYRDLRDFIFKHFQIRKFDFNEDEVLAHFLKIGIFVKEQEGMTEYVRFRFNCFFQFFLMKNMDIDPEFKEFVLHEDHYLYFIDEIEYYTGLKRDCSEILQLMVARMRQSYADVLDGVKQLKYGFDTFFETKRSIASALDSKFVTQVAKNKPTESQIESIQDEILESMAPEEGIIKKETEITDLSRYGRIWALSAIVLKNTEEIDIPGLKTDSFEHIIACSLAYSLIYKINLTEYLMKHKASKEPTKDKAQLSQLELLDRFLPLAHQIYTFTTLGTGKLSVIVRESIEKKLTCDDVSDLEKFLLVFLYSDLRGKEYHKYVKNLLKNIKHNYTRDMILFKILSYYFLRTNSLIQNNQYENLLGDIIAESKPGVRDEKGKAIRRFRLRKSQRLHMDRSVND